MSMEEKRNSVNSNKRSFKKIALSNQNHNISLEKCERLEGSCRLENQGDGLKRSGKSFKRYGSKHVIPAYSNYIIDNRKRESGLEKMKVRKNQSILKENDGGNNENKKKLKRIGKKAWVLAYKQIIEMENGLIDQTKTINNTPNNDFAEFEEKKDQYFQQKLSERESKVASFRQSDSDVLRNFREQERSPDQTSFDTRNSGLLSKVLSEIEHNQSQNDLLTPTDELSFAQSDAQKLTALLQNNSVLLSEDKEPKRAPIEYESYSINVCSSNHSTNQRLSTRPSNIRLQEVLNLLTEKINEKSEKKKIQKTEKNERQMPKSAVFNQKFGETQNKSSFYLQNRSTEKKCSSKTKKPLPSAYPFIAAIVNHGNDGEKLMKKGLSEHKHGTLLDRQKNEAKHLKVPSFEKIEKNSAGFRQFYEKQKSYESLHEKSEHLDKKQVKPSGITYSLKKSPKELEMNRYIREAKEDLKSSLHY